MELEEFILVLMVCSMCVGAGTGERVRKQSVSVYSKLLPTKTFILWGKVILYHCMKLSIFHSLCTSEVLHIETCEKAI